MTKRVPAAARAACEIADDFIQKRRFVEAIPAACEAAQLAPSWPEPWLDLTVAYKHAHRWRELLEAYDRAAALGASAKALWQVVWNAGIAATALGDWPRAHASWAAAGLKLPKGTGPINLNFGSTPIRVALDTAPEVVWCDRIDPCRAWITSVPLPDTDRRHGDLVLHDGEPRGKRALGDELVSVFDELTVLQRSKHRTWRATVRASTPDVIAELVALFADTKVVVEDWTASTYLICNACSLGTPHEPHDAPVGDWQVERRLGLAALRESQLRPLRGRREVLDLTLVT